MNFTKTMFALAIGSVGIMGAMSAQATAVKTYDRLTIQSPTFDSSGYVVGGSGSYFAMDGNGSGTFTPDERVAMSQGTTGLTIGMTTFAGPSHSGPPVGAEAGAIDAGWSFLHNTGSDYLVSAVTGDTTTGLDFRGWRVTWNGVPSISMAGGMQDCGTASDGVCVNPYGMMDISGTYNNGTGIAAFVWDGVYGHTYTIDYTAIVPQADPTGFGGVPYQLHLQGVVVSGLVPEASTYGMMLAGLGLVGLMARRRK
jgi:hypothetical protein